MVRGSLQNEGQNVVLYEPVSKQKVQCVLFLEYVWWPSILNFSVNNQLHYEKQEKSEASSRSVKFHLDIIIQSIH